MRRGGAVAQDDDSVSDLVLLAVYKKKQVEIGRKARHVEVP